MIAKSLLKGKRFAFKGTFSKEPLSSGHALLHSSYGNGGTYVSEPLSNLDSVADDMALLSGLLADNFNSGTSRLLDSDSS